MIIYYFQYQTQLINRPSDPTVVKAHNDLCQILHLSKNIEMSQDQYQNPKFHVGDRCMAPVEREGTKRFAEATITSIGVDGLVTVTYTCTREESVTALNQIKKARKKNPPKYMAYNG